MIRLHVASQQIKWHPEPAMCGWETPEALYDLLRLYDCAMGSCDGDAMDCYTNTFEVDRDDLIKMRNSIASRDSFFQEHESEIRRALKTAGLSPMAMADALDIIINNSDPDNGWVYLSWF